MAKLSELKKELEIGHIIKSLRVMKAIIKNKVVSQTEWQEAENKYSLIKIAAPNVSSKVHPETIIINHNEHHAM